MGGAGVDAALPHRNVTEVDMTHYLTQRRAEAAHAGPGEAEEIGGEDQRGAQGEITHQTEDKWRLQDDSRLTDYLS